MMPVGRNKVKPDEAGTTQASWIVNTWNCGLKWQRIPVIEPAKVAAGSRHA